MKENPILYVVLNGSLKMSSGKAAAQAVHAAMLLEGNYKKPKFVAGYKRTVVVLEAKDGETIKNLLEYLQGAGIFAAYYIDENPEDQPYQITALAVEPIAHDDTEKRSIFSDFPLFGYSKSDWGRWFHK